MAGTETRRSARDRHMTLTLCAVFAGLRHAIRELTRDAFRTMPFADGDEHELIDALRSAGALTVSLVAEHDDCIVGHIAIAPASAADHSTDWYAIGPVSVSPGFQRRGVGTRLVNAGLQRLIGRRAQGCILTGDPAYYLRFGFRVAAALAPEGEPAEFFMVKQLGETAPQSPFRFHPAFQNAR